MEGHVSGVMKRRGVTLRMKDAVHAWHSGIVRMWSVTLVHSAHRHREINDLGKVKPCCDCGNESTRNFDREQLFRVEHPGKKQP